MLLSSAIAKCGAGHSSRVRSVFDWLFSSACSSGGSEDKNVDFRSLLACHLLIESVLIGVPA